MNQDSNTAKNKKTVTSATGATAPQAKSPQAPENVKIQPLFRAIDWAAFGLTTLLVLLAYMLTIAPEVTLEDSGELAVGSMYAGVPHPPGYPVWTLVTWLFTKILPFSNIAWRVAVASAVAGAFACGLIALAVSRGSSMMIEGIASLKGIDRRRENTLCIVAGCVSGLLMGFNGYMWSQCVIVEVYSLSVLSLMGVICCLLRWVYAPQQYRYLYWAFFLFGICLTNHMSLLVAAVGIEIAIAAVQPRLGRDMFFGNAIVYVIVLMLKAKGSVSSFDNNPPLFVIFNVIGLGSIAAAGYLALKTQKLLTEWKPLVISAVTFSIGAAFYLYMPIASMSNPPMNWGYPRTAEGFMHAIKRGQYESVHPTSDVSSLLRQIWDYIGGATDEFSAVYLLLALTPFIFYRFMQKRERSWIIGLSGIYLCLSVLLLILLNPSPDRQSQELNRVFFTAGHVIIAMSIGYALTLLGAYLLTQYEKARFWALIGAGGAIAFSLYNLTSVVSTTFPDLSFFEGLQHALSEGENILPVYSGLFLLALAVFFLIVVLISRQRVPFAAVLAAFALMPVPSAVLHWQDNEQRGHMFGYWFGHDMFTPPFDAKNGKPLYPEMTKDAVLFGGTDPGRFNPTYMIFCDSFVGPKDKPDPNFDRRDVYLITQNALADNTYLNYIRAHYNRSAENDPPFFQNFFHTRALSFLDKIFLNLGDSIEHKRRAGTSHFKADDFADVASLRQKLQKQGDPVSKFVYEHLSKDTQALLGSGDDGALRGKLAKDLTALIESGKIYDEQRFKDVKLSDHSTRFIQEDPKGHTLVRWNRLLLEDTYSKEIAKSIGGVFPDLEIHTPSPEDSQRCFNDYLMDAERRYRQNQLKPGEDFRIDNGRVQVTGQVAVMSINGLLTKVIFDSNPKHEFYVEESFPLEWMFPHLTPFGVIMKINREPVTEITQDIADRDHEFWSKFSERLIGNWITYDTKITNICEFAERLYLRHDYRGFTGDRKFIRDDNAQKAFSKLRSSIGGTYSWRLGFMGFDCPAAYRASKNPEELKRVIRETEFAFKQAFAFCPYSPEAVYRFVQFLTNQQRHEEALAIARTCLKFDPENGQIENLVHQLEQISANVKKGPEMIDAQTAFNRINDMLQKGQTNQAMMLLDQMVNSPTATPDVILLAAKGYAQALDTVRLEKALSRLVQLVPDNPEAWYDLAGLQAMLGKTKESVENLKKAIQYSEARRKTDPKARNIIAEAQKDQRFALVRQDPEIQKLLTAPPQ